MKKPILIGFAGGLTGVGSELGRSGMYGAQLAVEDLNAAGGIMGREIKLEIKNDNSNPSVALQVDQELYDLGCRIIIGHMISGVAAKTVSFVNEKQILMISPTISTDVLTGIDDYFIRMIPDNLTQARLISKNISETNVKHLAIIHTSANLAFSQSIIDYIRNDLGNKGIQSIETFIYDASQAKDYYRITQHLISMKADGVVMLTSADETSQFAQVFALSGFKASVFLPAWAMTNDLLHQAGKTVEGFFGVNYVDLDSLEPNYVLFKERYFSRFGSAPSFASVLAYEAVMLAADAMERSKSTDPLQVKEAILKAKNFEGINDSYAFDTFGDIQRNIALYQMSDGKFTKVDSK